MICGGLLVVLMFSDPAGKTPPAPKPAAPVAATASARAPGTAHTNVAPEMSADDESTQMLAKVRRIYVDTLTGGDEALQFRDMVMSSLEQTKTFLVTENPDKADAVLKGAADDQVFTDYHDSEQSLGVHAQESHASGWRDRYDGGNNANSHGIGVTDSAAVQTEERKHEAFAALRLVDRDGDVIWSSTQESLGGKYAGASADVAARIAKQLATDYRRAKTVVAGVKAPQAP